MLKQSFGLVKIRCLRVAHCDLVLNEFLVLLLHKVYKVVHLLLQVVMV